MKLYPGMRCSVDVDLQQIVQPEIEIDFIVGQFVWHRKNGWRNWGKNELFDRFHLRIVK